MKRNIIVIIGLFVAIAAYSQESLTLSQAIELGLQRNYDISIQGKTVDIATNSNSWGQAGRWPSISLNLGQNNSLTDNIQTASPFQLQDITIANSLSPSLRLNWTLFNGFQVNITKSRLEQLQAESLGNADIVISNTIQATILLGIIGWF